MKKFTKPKFGMKKEKKPTAGSGNFNKLAGGVAKEYEKKGKSPEQAKKIGATIAAKVGAEKYGQKAMTKAAVAGKKSVNTSKPIDQYGKQINKLKPKRK